jgi:hypothetical protein
MDVLANKTVFYILFSAPLSINVLNFGDTYQQSSTQKVELFETRPVPIVINKTWSLSSRFGRTLFSVESIFFSADRTICFHFLAKYNILSQKVAFSNGLRWRFIEIFVKGKKPVEQFRIEIAADRRFAPTGGWCKTCKIRTLKGRTGAVSLDIGMTPLDATQPDSAISWGNANRPESFVDH